MRKLFQFITLISALATSLAWAQSGSCKVDLPVGIIGVDGSLLEGLTAHDLAVYFA